MNNLARELSPYLLQHAENPMTESDALDGQLGSPYDI